ncbi:MAG: hypothetical protein JW717_05800 [Marinilabiliaceae bacterium]|nr:hypothetical protein [Marinilabiliaceae bacterium]
MLYKKKVPLQILLNHYKASNLFISLIIYISIISICFSSNKKDFIVPITISTLYIIAIIIFVLIKKRTVKLINNGTVTIAKIKDWKTKHLGTIPGNIPTIGMQGLDYYKLKITYTDSNGINYSSTCTSYSEKLPTHILILYSTDNPKHYKVINNINLALVDFAFAKYEKEIKMAEKTMKQLTKYKSKKFE